MADSYIAWGDGRLRNLVYGVKANIPARSLFHGHACTTCGHAHACLCLGTDRQKRRMLRRCPWCTLSWEFRWARPGPKAKPRRRKTTRRVLQPVP